MMGLEIKKESEKGILPLQELAKQLKVPSVQLEDYWVDSQITKVLDEKLVRKYTVMPLEQDQERLIVAMYDPYDFYAIEEIKLATKLMVYPVLASKKKIEEMIGYYYSHNQTQLAAEALKRAVSTSKMQVKEDFMEESHIQEAPVVKMVHSIIQQAIYLGASDIHIEPFRQLTRIRMRIDGQLYEKRVLERQSHDSVVTRLKIMGKMDIAEKRIPQDGRCEWDNEKVDIRIAVIPTAYGEKVVLRLLSMSHSSILTMEELGLTEGNKQQLGELLQSPSGMILVTGPTGSGKSTTLYAILNERKQLAENIITLEEPIEKRIDGINQVPINLKAGLTFATGLRAILRQDPDVMMIGEIRDTETVQIAMRAAVTGHLVFSTLHTSDAMGTLIRLLDMGIEPYMVAAALKGIISQRLVRKVCNKCKKAYQPTVEEMKILGMKESVEIYKGEGCPHCQGTGYKGRIGVYEIVRVDNELKHMINQKQAIKEIQTYINKSGYLGLPCAIKQMVLQGRTTLEEYVRLAYDFDTL